MHFHCFSCHLKGKIQSVSLNTEHTVLLPAIYSMSLLCDAKQNVNKEIHWSSPAPILFLERFPMVFLGYVTTAGIFLVCHVEDIIMATTMSVITTAMLRMVKGF